MDYRLEVKFMHPQDVITLNDGDVMVGAERSDHKNLVYILRAITETDGDE